MALRCHEVDWQRAQGLRAELVDGRGARSIEPALGDAVLAGAHFPDESQVDRGTTAQVAANSSLRSKRAPINKALDTSVNASGKCTTMGCQSKV